MRKISRFDSTLSIFDNFLKTISSSLSGTGRKISVDNITNPDMTVHEREKSGSLMRVNHAGEVAAQALYQGQLVFEKDPQTINYLSNASDEEADHLIWTSAQLKRLNSKESYLNVLWYSGAFMLGLAASLSGAKNSMSFLAETERQVAIHLEGHMEKLPENDIASRQIVQAMLADETAHANWAENSKDFSELPKLLKSLMRRGAGIMIFFSKRI